MKNYLSRIKWMTLVVLTITLFGCAQQKSKDESENVKPNIIIIVADDLGYSDIAPFGGNIKTPTLSNLAKEG